MSEILQQLVIFLFLWSLVSMGGAILALYVVKGEWSRSFWFMSGLWGWIDGGIALYALLRPVESLEGLRDVLLINIGLDVAYMITGVALTRFSSSKLRGFGWAILVQGMFLLVLDSCFWWKCRQALIMP
ncbi:MAG: hypothetical protein ACFCD0_19125 [Gemmataceae bacterium]